MGSSRLTNIVIECEQCGETFNPWSSKPDQQFCSRSCFYTHNRAENHPAWTETPTYSTVHWWIAREMPLTGTCSKCGDTPEYTERANPGHQYRRKLSDWIEVCVPCHRELDDHPNKRKVRA